MQQVLLYGRDTLTNQWKPINYNRGALDVYIQDQNTELVNWIVHQDLNDITLAVSTTIDSQTITLNAGHNVVAGNIISLLQDAKFYQGIVTNVNVNAITLDSPLDKQYRADRTYIATRGTHNIAVNGSVTPQVFHIKPAPNQIWDITQIIVYIVDDAAMDDTTLGGIAAVTNGIVIRKKDGAYKNLGNIKRNGDLKVVGCDVEYATKVGGGQYSVVGVCKFAQDAGVTIRLSNNEEIEVTVQDNLSAITSIIVTVIGHVVE